MWSIRAGAPTSWLGGPSRTTSSDSERVVDRVVQGAPERLRERVREVVPVAELEDVAGDHAAGITAADLAGEVHVVAAGDLRSFPLASPDAAREDFRLGDLAAIGT